eukprot:11585305-Karenia_brevis.AAC.1
MSVVGGQEPAHPCILNDRPKNAHAICRGSLPDLALMHFFEVHLGGSDGPLDPCPWVGVGAWSKSLWD